MTAIVWELVDFAKQDAQSVLTRYYFWDAAGTALPSDLSAAYKEVVLPALIVAQSSSVVHYQLSIRQVYPSLTLTTLYPLVPNVPGGDTNPPAATTTTFSLQLIPGETTDPEGATATPYIKRGGKHIGGVSADFVNASGGYNHDADTFLAAYATTLISPATTPFVCVIAHQPPGGVVTRLAPVINYTIHDFGTQVNRKVGRGA